MPQKIAILRGINVGGKRVLRMAELRELCEQLGWNNVSTYIQSGNIFFESERPEAKLESELHSAIKDRFGYDVPVIVRSKEELSRVIQKNPFLDTHTDISTLHLTFLRNRPTSEAIEKIQSFDHSPDQFHIHNRYIFLSIPGKYHQTKLSNQFFEKKLEVETTTRNWKTVLRLLER